MPVIVVVILLIITNFISLHLVKSVLVVSL